MTTDALPPWMTGPRGNIELLAECLHPYTPARLVELIGEAGGLTPPEARLWIDIPDRAWWGVELALYLILAESVHAGCPMPFHLERWTVRTTEKLSTPVPAVTATEAAHQRYRIEARNAFAEMEQRIEQGGDFDRELMRFEHTAQLLRERHNVFLWDGPTTARGFRHPAWPALDPRG